MYYSAPRWWHRARQDKEREESRCGSSADERDAGLMGPLPPARDPSRPGAAGTEQAPVEPAIDGRDGAQTPVSRVQGPWTMSRIALRALRSISGGLDVVAGPNNT